MDNLISYRLQAIAILLVLIFMVFVFKLIIKGKLRAEYSFVWIACTSLLLVFSIWRNGLDVIASLIGVYYAPALLFIVAILAIVLFLVHLSVVNSRQHEQIKILTQEMALLKKKIDDQKQIIK